ncbi:MAG: alpha/beta hydrolase [Ignavibacteriales bacterium]|nr:alpha/beta hydrolase [Ignavibacteriales bacterium]
MKKIILIIFVSSILISAQTNKIIKDTSYTVYSTFNKLKKDFPFIKPVKPILPNEVNALREITYINYGERELKLDLFFNQPGEILKPAIILIHGGGWRTGDKSLMFPMALQFAKKGFVAAVVEYRLAPETIFPAAIIDVNNSIKWLKQNSFNFRIDTNKIALLGCSAGGQIASLIGFANDEKEFEDSVNYKDISNNVSAILNIDGLLDFLGKESEEYDENPNNSKPRAAHQWLGASQIDRPDLWKKASGINYIKKNSPPILFLNSSQPRFHAGRDAAIESLDKYNIYNEVHTLEDSPHSFWLFHPWFNETVNIVDQFLKKVMN